MVSTCFSSAKYMRTKWDFIIEEYFGFMSTVKGLFVHGEGRSQFPAWYKMDVMLSGDLIRERVRKFDFNYGQVCSFSIIHT